MLVTELLSAPTRGPRTLDRQAQQLGPRGASPHLAHSV